MYKDDTRRRRRVVRMVYEVCTFQALREQLRCKEIWVVGADKWRNPAQDVLGEAKYGPNKPDATRGGRRLQRLHRNQLDYSHLIVPVIDSPEAPQQYCLDCSGFIRSFLATTWASQCHSTRLPTSSV